MACLFFRAIPIINSNKMGKYGQRGYCRYEAENWLHYLGLAGIL